MCGIGGYISKVNDDAKRDLVLNSMAHLMRFRGPEFNRKEFIPNGGLVHNRLKIIDLSDSANQPMTSRCGNYMIVFNGEAYNFKYLQKKYCSPDFNSDSDTETLVECLANHPIKEVIAATKGMFVLALYHLPTQKIYLVRDRFGQKPLYYSLSNEEFYFCSDIRGISKNKSNLSLDYESIDYYLSELAMPQPKTIFNEIKQISPGTIATITDFQLKEEAYYEMKIVQPYENKSEQEWLLAVENGLIDAAESQLVSDVNIGFFLSGGVDSGLIVALMAQKSKTPINTYTAVYNETDFDESKDAEKLSKRYGTNHHEIKIDASHVDEILWELIFETGEPFADSSLLPSYFVSREIAKHVKVAISGDGGDELFGYPEYQYALGLDIFGKKKPLTRNLTALKARISNRINSNNLSLEAAFAHSLKYDLNGELLNRNMGFSESEKDVLYKDDALKLTRYLKRYHKVIWEGIDTEVLYAKKLIGGYKTRLLNDYLVKVDRSSMFNSLEVRSPFLDHDLVNLVCQIPGEFNFKNNQPKYILKKLAEKHVDEDIFSRKKRGFGIPITKWLKNDLKSYVDKYLSMEQLQKRNLVEWSFIQKILSEHNQGIKDHRHKIWAILCLEIWFEQNLD